MPVCLLPLRQQTPELIHPVLTWSLAPAGLGENQWNRDAQSVSTSVPSSKLAREQGLGLLWEEYLIKLH